MTFISRNLKYIATAFVAAAIGVTAANVYGQSASAGEKSKNKDEYRGFCSNNNWGSDEKVSSNDLREMTIPASGSINVDAGKNGGIGVVGEDRSDVLIRACVQAWGNSAEAAKAAVAAVRINTSGTIKAESSSDDRNFSVSYQIAVPRSTNLDLSAHNGGISIAGVDGKIDFETQNGGVNLKNLSGDVKGRTTNGGVNVLLAGSSWKGSGMDVLTTNGGINLTMAANYAATVETGTVNGGYKSDIPALNVTTEDIKGDWSARMRAKRITTNLNGGGAPIKVMTTNGGVKINTLEQ